jgi:hypothetical protein
MMREEFRKIFKESEAKLRDSVRFVVVTAT